MPLLRAGQQILTRRSIAVNSPLQGGHQFRNKLDLIQDHGAWMVVQEEIRIPSGVADVLGGIKNDDPGLPAKNVLEQGALADLTGT